MPMVFVIGPDGFAESSADLLADFLIEHSDDPDEGPPEDWPDWTDEIRLDLGAETVYQALEAGSTNRPSRTSPTIGLGA